MSAKPALRQLHIAIDQVKIEPFKGADGVKRIEQVEIIGRDGAGKINHITAFNEHARQVAAMRLKPGDKILTAWKPGEDQPCFCHGGHVCEQAPIEKVQ
jgi:hypothetical protein